MTSNIKIRLRVGFTLVELLVVIAIIGILIALLLPAVQAAREAARRMQCSGNLKQIGLAIHSYYNANGVLPVSITYHRSDYPRPSLEVNGHGWTMSILPYLEQNVLYEQLRPGFDGDFESGGGLFRPECREAMKTRTHVYQCPSDPSAQENSTERYQWIDIEVSTLSYKGVIGDTRLNDVSMHQGSPPCQMTPDCPGLLWRNTYISPIRFQHITDGTSNTLAVGEDVPSHNNAGAAYFSNGDYASCHAPLNYLPNPPTPYEWYNVMSFRSLHPGGAHFCLADASVRFFNEDIEHTLYRALSTKAGGEAVRVP